MEPAMTTDTGMASIFGPIFGTSSGAGMGLLMFFSGVVATSVGIIGYFIPNIRNAEDILPDHDALEKSGQDNKVDSGGPENIPD